MIFEVAAFQGPNAKLAVSIKSSQEQAAKTCFVLYLNFY